MKAIIQALDILHRFAVPDARNIYTFIAPAGSKGLFVASNKLMAVKCPVVFNGTELGDVRIPAADELAGAVDFTACVDKVGAKPVTMRRHYKSPQGAPMIMPIKGYPVENLPPAADKSTGMLALFHLGMCFEIPLVAVESFTKNGFKIQGATLTLKDEQCSQIAAEDATAESTAPVQGDFVAGETLKKLLVAYPWTFVKVSSTKTGVLFAMTLGESDGSVDVVFMAAKETIKPATAPVVAKTTKPKEIPKMKEEPEKPTAVPAPQDTAPQPAVALVLPSQEETPEALAAKMDENITVLEAVNSRLKELSSGVTTLIRDYKQLKQKTVKVLKKGGADTGLKEELVRVKKERDEAKQMLKQYTKIQEAIKGLKV